MKEEKSLIKFRDSVFSNLIKKIKSFFTRFREGQDKINNNETIIKASNTLNDFNVLEGIIKENIKIEDVDINTKKRLITICNQRLERINEKIEDENLEILKLEKLIDEVDSLI